MDRIIKLASRARTELERFIGWFNSSPRRGFVWLAIASTLAVVVNTLYVFVTESLHGDVVAQQLIISQWLNDVPADQAIIGPTNYLLKFPFYYLIEGWLSWVSPFVRLIGTALLFNVIGWLLILIFTFKVANVFQASKSQKVILGWILLFISLISASVFWLSYPNSRNIEIGLIIVALFWIMSIFINKQNRLFSAAACSIFLGVIFTNDQYAIFAIGLPVGLFFVWKMILAFKKSDTAGKISALYAGGTIGGGTAIYLLLIKLINLLTPVHLVSKDSQPSPSITQLWENTIAVLDGVAKTLGVYTSNLPNPRFLLFYIANFLIFCYLVYVMLKRRNRPVGVLSASIFLWISIVIIAVAILTSLVAQRYMIIVPFMLGLYVALTLKPSRKVINLLAFMVIVSGMALILATLPATVRGVKNQRWHEINSETYSIINTAEEHSITKGYVSLLYAQTVSYMSDRKVTALPLSCNFSKDGTKVHAYVQSWLIERATISAKANKAFVYVSENGACDGAIEKDQLIKQIGSPDFINKDTPGGTMLIYDHDIRSKL
jgi:hypothetical protein